MPLGLTELGRRSDVAFGDYQQMSRSNRKLVLPRVKVLAFKYYQALVRLLPAKNTTLHASTSWRGPRPSLPHAVLLITLFELKKAILRLKMAFF